jgi:hypothetical protein
MLAGLSPDASPSDPRAQLQAAQQERRSSDVNSV